MSNNVTYNLYGCTIFFHIISQLDTIFGLKN